MAAPATRAKALDVRRVFQAGDTIALSMTLEGSGSIAGASFVPRFWREADPTTNLGIAPTVSISSAADRRVTVTISAADSAELVAPEKDDDVAWHRFEFTMTLGGEPTTFGPVRFPVRRRRSWA